MRATLLYALATAGSTCVRSSSIAAAEHTVGADQLDAVGSPRRRHDVRLVARFAVIVHSGALKYGRVGVRMVHGDAVVGGSAGGPVATGPTAHGRARHEVIFLDELVELPHGFSAPAVRVANVQQLGRRDGYSVVAGLGVSRAAAEAGGERTKIQRRRRVKVVEVQRESLVLRPLRRVQISVREYARHGRAVRISPRVCKQMQHVSRRIGGVRTLRLQDGQPPARRKMPIELRQQVLVTHVFRKVVVVLVPIEIQQTFTEKPCIDRELLKRGAVVKSAGLGRHGGRTRRGARATVRRHLGAAGDAVDTPHPIALMRSLEIVQAVVDGFVVDPDPYAGQASKERTPTAYIDAECVRRARIRAALARAQPHAHPTNALRTGCVSADAERDCEAERVGVAVPIRHLVRHGMAARRGRRAGELARARIERETRHVRRETVSQGAVAACGFRQRQRVNGRADGVGLVARRSRGAETREAVHLTGSGRAPGDAAPQ